MKQRPDRPSKPTPTRHSDRCARYGEQGCPLRAPGSHVTVSGMTGLSRIPMPALDWTYRYLLARTGAMEESAAPREALEILRGILRWIEAERAIRGVGGREKDMQ